MKNLKLILNWIAGITLYIICVQSLSLLFKTFEHSIYLEYFMFFGLGLLLYHPIKYILKS